MKGQKSNQKMLTIKNPILEKCSAVRNKNETVLADTNLADLRDNFYIYDVSIEPLSLWIEHQFKN